MKYRWILLLSALLLSGGYALGQDDMDQLEDPEGKIKSMRVAYLTNRLQLTPEESQRFWPVYNQYENEQRSIRSRYRPKAKIELMSDAELERHITDNFTMEEQLLKLKRDYYQRMKGLIGIRKIAMLPRAERDFNVELIKQLQAMRAKRQQQRRN